MTQFEKIQQLNIQAKNLFQTISEVAADDVNPKDKDKMPDLITRKFQESCIYLTSSISALDKLLEKYNEYREEDKIEDHGSNLL